jgi:hypothetical protein
MNSIIPVVSSSTWDSGAMLAKAQRYAEEMQRHAHDDWRFAFWSSLTLELIARSALAKVSPVLLADHTNWNNLYFALGNTPNASKFSPKSITIAEVLSRLGEIIPEFNKELEKSCIVHTGNRNAELHSGDTPFDGKKSSSWLPSFYESCDVLLKFLGSTLEQLFGKPEAKAAKKLIAAARDDAAKAVASLIKAHQTVWSEKSTKEREKLTAQSAVWATKQDGHVVGCPACQAKALLEGEPISAPKKTINDDLITETQQFLPRSFECIACGLKIAGLSRLTACGLGEPYKRTSTYDAASYYAPDDAPQDYEDDNNEPF